MKTKSVFSKDKNFLRAISFPNSTQGGRIDHAHHSNLGQKALADTLAFEEAISKAMGKVNLHETLIIVSADHSHTFSVSGYALFEENILGKRKIWTFETFLIIIFFSGFGDFNLSEVKDGKPILQMGYINGPGALYHRYDSTGKIINERKNLGFLDERMYFLNISLNKIWKFKN